MQCCYRRLLCVKTQRLEKVEKERVKTVQRGGIQDTGSVKEEKVQNKILILGSVLYTFWVLNLHISKFNWCSGFSLWGQIRDSTYFYASTNLKNHLKLRSGFRWLGAIFLHFPRRTCFSDNLKTSTLCYLVAKLYMTVMSSYTFLSTVSNLSRFSNTEVHINM